ncbi:MAG: stealth conserved region 3 domain-containing protein [Sporichthyaceae bacterium]
MGSQLPRVSANGSVGPPLTARAARLARRALRSTRRQVKAWRAAQVHTPEQFLQRLGKNPGREVAAALLAAPDATLSVTKHGPVIASTTPASVRRHREATLEALVSLLEAAQLDYFLVPAAAASSVPSVGLRAGDARAALDLVARDAATAWYAGYRPPDGPDEPSRLVCGLSPDDILAATRSPSVLLWTYREVSSPPSLIGRRHSVSLEFWDPGPRHTLTARTHNPMGRILGSTVRTEAPVTVGGREYRSLAALQAPRWNQVQFPIDVVYTWVDGSDPEWAGRRAQFTGAAHDHAEESVTEARFRHRDELRHSLRSLEAYAPWVRHIWIVTDRQTPAWLDTTAPGLTVVDHSEIFDAADLPTYNSHAIEARLHHIEGLAENYLYFNDDMLLGRPVNPELFFLSNGIPKFFHSRNTIPITEADECVSALESARRTSQTVIDGEFGRAPHHIFRHAPYPQSRSLLHDLEARFPKEFARTAASRFRAPTDIIVTSWIHAYGGYFLGRAVPDDIVYGYADPGTPEGRTKLSTLLVRPVDSICINDTMEADSALAQAAIESFFAEFLPTPCRFEKI